MCGLQLGIPVACCNVIAALCPVGALVQPHFGSLGEIGGWTFHLGPLGQPQWPLLTSTDRLSYGLLPQGHGLSPSQSYSSHNQLGP